ncbi:MAG TPA: membrane-bound lytic murein transglycosylase MltF [Rhodocyclaceae bacterium]|nr:membrane-bound lytic murein transglycosylase MltF [Rhodocyclaceae bacterium]
MRCPARLPWLPLAAALILAACARLDPPEQRGELVVAVRADPVFFQQEAGGAPAAGFEHDLVEEFARDLGVPVRFVIARDHDELLDLVRRGKAHFAAAVPAISGAADLRYTQPLRESRLLVVQHADALPHDDPASLAQHAIEVLPNSPEFRALRRLPVDLPLSLAEVAADNELDLLARVAEQKAELAATDSAHFDVAVNYYPDLVVAMELPDRAAYVWAFFADDKTLQEKAAAFLTRVRRDGTLARLDDRYFGHIKRINANGMTDFLDAMQTLLPRYRRNFEQAQATSGVDWRLLAALAYQESKWDALATSPTGVRGLMMLTEDTADRLGVNNRLDPAQSIRAAARYLAEFRDELPATVKEPDRTWLALATYNLGQGHMNGARQFAVGLKRDPGSWYEMKKVLPLLARPEYYERLKSGRARGGEAVIMVENIRSYYGVLCRFAPSYAAGLRLSKPPMYGIKADGTSTVPLPF